MNKEQAETLNTVQEVLRHVVIALAGASGCDKAKLAHLLDAGASNEQLEPASRAMLRDLAAGLDIMASAIDRKQ